MPVPFPALTDSGRIEQQPHFTVAELAAMFHTTREAVYRRTASGEWPFVKIVRTVYFSPGNVRQILAEATHNVRPIGDDEPELDPPRMRAIGGGR